MSENRGQISGTGPPALAVNIYRLPAERRGIKRNKSGDKMTALAEKIYHEVLDLPAEERLSLMDRVPETPFSASVLPTLTMSPLPAAGRGISRLPLILTETSLFPPGR
jgi:hypothetical protein